MSKFEAKPGSVAIFSNMNKEKENHPDANGTIKLDRDYKAGEEIKIAVWKKQDKKGNNYFSGVISKPMTKKTEPVQNDNGNDLF